MFIKLPFKLTVISEIEMYYTIRRFWSSLCEGHRQNSEEGIYLGGRRPSVLFCFIPWRIFFSVAKTIFLCFISCILTTSYKLNDSLGLLNVFLHIFLPIVNTD